MGATEGRSVGDEARADLPADDEEFSAEDEALLGEIRDFFVAFLKAVRAAQLYVEGNPLLHQFVEDLRSRLKNLWARLPSLNLTIYENEIRWCGRPIYTEEVENKENLAFQFYRDGIRRLELHPGVEGEELQQLLDLLRFARHMKDDEEDLLTLIWYRDFVHIRYEYVDVLGDEPPLPEIRSPEADTQLPVLPELELSPALETPTLREDFEPALYFLGEQEVSQLREELKKEWDRPLKREVMAAFLDQFEVGDQDRRYEVANIIRQMLPQFLAVGEFSQVGWILDELRSIAEHNADPAVGVQVDDILGELSEPAAVQQLVRLLDDASVELEADTLHKMLGALRPEAVVVLLQSLPSLTREKTRRQLLATVERLVAEDPERITELLASKDSIVAGEAATIAGRLKLTETTGAIAILLKRSDAAVRVAAVDALGSMMSLLSGDALIQALDDSVRDVRVGAARSLALLKYGPGADELERHIRDSSLWKGDLSEQRAFFEAFGQAAGIGAIRLLARILNGRRFLWIRYPGPTRACAARALGLIASDDAARALEAGASDSDMMVRTAVLTAQKRMQAGGGA